MKTPNFRENEYINIPPEILNGTPVFINTRVPIKKLKAIIEKEKVIGYVNGKPVTESQYISEIDIINQ